MKSCSKMMRFALCDFQTLQVKQNPTFSPTSLIFASFYFLYLLARWTKEQILSLNGSDLGTFYF